MHRLSRALGPPSNSTGRCSSAWCSSRLGLKGTDCMKCLVTGGAGFIGSNLTAFLAASGHDAVVLDNLLTGYARNVPTAANVRFVAGDIRDPQIVRDVAQGC